VSTKAERVDVRAKTVWASLFDPAETTSLAFALPVLDIGRRTGPPRQEGEMCIYRWTK